jgi:hypothetical protein
VSAFWFACGLVLGLAVGEFMRCWRIAQEAHREAQAAKDLLDESHEGAKE